MTQHRYVASGWGVGEVWAEDGVLVLHDLAGTVPGLELDARAPAGGRSGRVRAGRARAPPPLPPKGGTRAPTGTVAAKSSREANGFVPDLCRRFAAHLAGCADGLRRRTHRRHGAARRSSGSCCTRCGPFPGARWSATASSPRSPGRPRAARAAGTFCAENQFSLVVPCHRVVASDGIGGYGSSGVGAQAAAPRARGGGALSHAPLAEDVRAELAAIAPTRRCDRLAETSALFHTAGTVHLRGRGALAFHLDVASNAIARRAFALLRELRVDAEIRTYQRRAFGGDDPLPAPPRRRRAHARRARRGGRARPRPRAARASARAASSAKPCCRGAYLRGVFLGGGSLSGPRSPHLELRAPTHAGAAFVRSVASTRRARGYASSTGPVTPPPTRRAASRSRRSSQPQARRRRCSASRSRRSWPSSGPRRTGWRTPTTPTSSARAVPRGGSSTPRSRLRSSGALERLPEPVREAAELRLRHPSLSLRELAAKAAPPATKAAMQRRLARVVEAGDAG